MLDVSHLLISHQHAASLPHVVRALLQQLGDHSREVIAIDDASSDGSLAVLQGLAAQDSRIRVFFASQRMGAAACLNMAAQQAQGRWLHVVDASAVVAANGCDVMLARMQQSHADLGYAHHATTDDTIDALPGRMMQSHPSDSISDDPLDTVLHHPYHGLGLMVRASVFAQAQGADATLPRLETSLLLRIAKQAQRALILHGAMLLVPAPLPEPPHPLDHFLAYSRALSTLPSLSRSQQCLLRRHAITQAWHMLRPLPASPLRQQVRMAYLTRHLPVSLRLHAQVLDAVHHHFLSFHG